MTGRPTTRALNCPDCAATISVEAVVCPKCGAWFGGDVKVDVIITNVDISLAVWSGCW